MEKVIVLNNRNFEKEVLQSEIPVLVDFWGSWCPPCKMIEPALRDISNELDGKIKIAKLNVDQNPIIRRKCNIIGLPTLILFQNGVELNRKSGAMSKRQILNFIDSSLN